MNVKLRYLVLSDIHLGHNHNRTDNIVENLRYYIKINHKLFKNLQIIFLAGDLYDKLLANNSIDYILATEWLTELMLYCMSNNIKLRVLEGTPSHDWRQSKAITSIISKLNIEIDFKYIDTLYIEKMLDLNLNILYVPDEYKHKASETYIDVLELMKEANLTKVDISIMHGQFHFQLPMIKLESSHTEIDYLSIVKHFISIGHIHTPGIYDRIVAQGSFDRLAHNEEEDKGGMYFTIYKNDTSEYQFIKNTKAKIFKTINYSNVTLEELLDNLDKEIKKYPIDSYVRLIVAKDTKINSSIKIIKERYIGYTIKIETEKDKVLQLTTDIVQNNIPTESYHITPENITELLMYELDKYSLDNNEVILIKQEMKQLLSVI